MHQAASIGKLFRIGYTLARGRRPTRWRCDSPLASDASTPVALPMISGGVGTMLADRVAERGLQTPALPDAAAQRLLASIPFTNPTSASLIGP